MVHMEITFAVQESLTRNYNGLNTKSKIEGKYRF